MANNRTIEEVINDYPFLNYINEDKIGYKHAKDVGYKDPDDLFLIGESGGFLLNIQPGDRFVNTHLFTEMADFYRKNKCYTFYKVDSIPHRQLRKREQLRRKEGFSAPCFIRNGKLQNIRITGNHYTFLNYIVMEQLNDKTITSSDKASVASKFRDFSKFIDAQFWTWHVIEFAKNNGFHIIIDKTRRGGFSYMMAAKTANTLNLYPNKVVIHVAKNNDYLTAPGGLTDFATKNLEFFEHKTPFVRGILSTKAEEYRLGFKLANGQESPQSWNSALFSVSAHNNPNCAIGKDAVEVNVEELSTMENFDEFMAVTEPAMTTGAYVTGNLCCWGTATAGNMQIFEQNFYNPKAYNFMPFENVWDKDKRAEVCGYFKSYAWGLQGQIGDRFAMDKDGNSDIALGLQVAYNERAEKERNAKTRADYINYLGQRAIYPSESFSSATENIFTSLELMAWEERLKNDNSFKFYTDGMLYEDNGKIIFKSNAKIEAEGGKHNVDYYDYIQNVPRRSNEHPHGCIRIWFSPLKIKHPIKENGEIRMIEGTPPGMYSISYDPVGVSKENKLIITNKHSHNSIKVWMNPTKDNGFKTALVASYFGRTEQLEEADKICLLLAKYYNCIGTTGVEINRGETVSNFKKWNATRYLMKDPQGIWNTSFKANAVMSYGISMGTDTKKLEGLRLLKEMLYSVVGKNENGEDIYLFQTIYDHQSILELRKWNNVGNFDRVSEMIIRGIQWHTTNIESAKQLETRKSLKRESIFDRDWF